MKESLSNQQARKLVLLSQRLPPTKSAGSALAATLSAIEDLGYVQIDTISAIQRAHHHTLWNRNPRYKTSHLDQLTADKQVFEYWSHAAAYLPMRDYRYSLPRKHAIANGTQDHWYDRDAPLMKSVLRRIATEGPLMAKDFDHTGKKTSEWGSKPAKRALECLFIQGELMIPYRVHFHKVYDLTERVLPEQVNTTPPSPEEHARFMITRYLQANGLGRPAEISYLLKNTKARITSTLQEMVSSGEVLQILALAPDKIALELLSFLTIKEQKDPDLYNRLIQLIIDRAHLNFNFALLLLKNTDSPTIKKVAPLLRHILSNETDKEMLEKFGK